MHNYYLNLFNRLLIQLHEIADSPWQNSLKCLSLQEELIKKTSYIENKIRELKSIKKNKKLLLTKKTFPYLTKEQSKKIKSDINLISVKISGYYDVLNFLKCIGDGLIFIYIPKWDVKPWIFKEDSGFLSKKIGLKLELQILRKINKRGVICILNDLTSCMRHGDIVVIQENKPITLIEAKTKHHDNARTRKQAEEADKIINYLIEDKTNRDGYEINRLNFGDLEVSNQDKMVNVINEAYEKGHHCYEVEKGLFYCAQTYFDAEKIKHSFPYPANNVDIFFLNYSKYDAMGYYPFTLSLPTVKSIIDFYTNNLLLFVAIDRKAIQELYSNLMIKVEFLYKEDYAFLIETSNQSIKKDIGPIYIGKYLYHRIATEFISLQHFINNTSKLFYDPDLFNKFSTLVGKSA